MEKPKVLYQISFKGAMQSSTSQLLQQQQQQPQPVKPPTLFAGLVNSVKNSTSPYHQPGTTDVVCSTPLSAATGTSANGIDCRSFAEKYGRCQELSGVDPLVLFVYHTKSWIQHQLQKNCLLSKNSKENQMKAKRSIIVD